MNRFISMLLAAAVSAAMSAPGAASADVRLPGIFSHNMILQRSAPIPVWGWAAPGEHVTVSFRGESATATADDNGRWKVTLPATSVSATPRTFTVRGRNTIELENVLVGEVWLCAGQSNMQLPVSRAATAEEAISGATYDQIRLFKVPLSARADPADDVSSGWVECSPGTVPDFSAVGYFFGRELHLNLYIPIGLIQAAWGGSPIEAWTSRNALEQSVAAQSILGAWDAAEKMWNAGQARDAHEEALEKWREDSLKLRAEGKQAPPEPSLPSAPLKSPHRPGNLFHGMIQPLVPFAIRGAIWYQGESNAARAYQYRQLFPLMIGDWRSHWDQGPFPFYFVQLAGFHEPNPEPGQESPWAELQEAQLLALQTKNTGMAVANDLGAVDTIRPPAKAEVGRRLALWALARQHDLDVTPSGPLYREMRREGDRIRVFFDFGEGLATRDSKPPGSFEIAGDDMAWRKADVVIEGESVVVSHPEILEPAAVRYAWTHHPVDANLVNGAGLPASVFRTDQWPRSTEKKSIPAVR